MAERRTVLVTGANKGIGYEIVKTLLQSSRRYHVLIGSRSLERGQEAAEKLRAECADTSSTVEPLQLDVSDDFSIEKAFEAVKTSIGHIDALVNNAGV